MSRTSDTYIGGESDGRVLPTKCPNNGGAPSAEGMEGRRPTKENIGHTTAPRTQSRSSASSGWLGVREVARKDKRVRFTALLHHVTVALLWDSFYALKRDAAPGVDAVTWKEYETDLDARLKDLHGRVHAGTYRAQPSKRAHDRRMDLMCGRRSCPPTPNLKGQLQTDHGLCFAALGTPAHHRRPTRFERNHRQVFELTPFRRYALALLEPDAQNPSLCGAVRPQYQAPGRTLIVQISRLSRGQPYAASDRGRHGRSARRHARPPHCPLQS
jgi:hypothetical protein